MDAQHTWRRISTISNRVLIPYGDSCYERHLCLVSKPNESCQMVRAVSVWREIKNKDATDGQDKATGSRALARQLLKNDGPKVPVYSCMRV